MPLATPDVPPDCPVHVNLPVLPALLPPPPKVCISAEHRMSTVLVGREGR